MAPNGENQMTKNTGSSSNNSSSSSSSSRGSENKIIHNKLPSLSMESLQRTISDISLELITMQALDGDENGVDDHGDVLLVAIPEVAAEVVARCECCGMAEECTGEYMGRVRAKFSGRFVCGLCAEAMAEEMAKRGSPHEEAIGAHMADCSRFNRLARAYPSLFQAQAVKEILKKSSSCGNGARTKSLSPRDCIGKNNISSNGSLARSSSCIPAIRKEI